MITLPLPPLKKSLIVNLEWAQALRNALPLLWDGLDGTAHNTYYEFICYAVDHPALAQEIRSRLGEDVYTFRQWLILQGYPADLDDRIVQNGRREWMLDMILEFSGECIVI